MRVITERFVVEAAANHPMAANQLNIWLTVTEAATWKNLVEVRGPFPHADQLRVASGRAVTVFNIRRNEFRLITAIHFNRQAVYTLRFLTHAEYDKENWKREL